MVPMAITSSAAVPITASKTQRAQHRGRAQSVCELERCCRNAVRC